MLQNLYGIFSFCYLLLEQKSKLIFLLLIHNMEPHEGGAFHNDIFLEKKTRISLSFVVKFKLVTVISNFLLP